MESRKTSSHIQSWLVERLPFLPALSKFLSEKTVPRHKYSFFYLFGGMVLFLLFIQLITGTLLALYYSPYPEAANESVRFIMTSVNFGWLVRSLHVWGANAIVVVVLIHMASTFFMRAYRRPRELVWMSGVVAFFLVLGFAFTGYLLPWDTTAYFATQIGTEIPKSFPVIGTFVVALLRGGEDIGHEALKRMHAIHTIILPITSLIFIVFHVILQQFVGTSAPPVYAGRTGTIRFYPNYIYRDGIAWLLVGIALLGLSTMLPAGLGARVDPLASAPVGIKPEWYFLPLYQTLRMFPTSVFSMSGEMIVNILVAIASTALLLVPFIDNKSGMISKSVVTLGIVAIAYYAGTILLAYLI